MDTIQFDLEPAAKGLVSPTINIYINEIELVELVSQIELPSAKSEGHPELAGAYMGMNIDDVNIPLNHFLGSPAEYLSYDDKVQILQCACGESGCWPLVSRIYVTDDLVTWSDFENPHRNGKGNSRIWHYENFGPFRFDLSQYKNAMKSLQPI